MDQKDDVSKLTQLGSKNTDYKLVGANREILEWFPNPAPESDYEIIHEFGEFTSLCPKTGQPDFAEAALSYIANERCVETKSLKLYFFAFRNEGAFMERITNQIANDLIAVLQPRRLLFEMKFKSRGGIQTSCVRNYIAPWIDIDEDEDEDSPPKEYEKHHQN